MAIAAENDLLKDVFGVCQFDTLRDGNAQYPK